MRCFNNICITNSTVWVYNKTSSLQAWAFRKWTICGSPRSIIWAPQAAFGNKLHNVNIMTLTTYNEDTILRTQLYFDYKQRNGKRSHLFFCWTLYNINKPRQDLSGGQVINGCIIIGQEPYTKACFIKKLVNETLASENSAANQTKYLKSVRRLM